MRCRHECLPLFAGCWRAVWKRIPVGGYVTLAMGCLNSTRQRSLCPSIRLRPQGTHLEPDGVVHCRRLLRPALRPSWSALLCGPWRDRPLQPPRSLVRFEVNTPADGPLAMTTTMRDVAMSPDGKHIVYQSSTGGVTGRRLYVRHLDQPEVTMLKGTERAQSPFFSPDGQWVGFVVTDARTMRKVPVLGGPAVPIADLPDDIPRGISWGADDSIVFATSSSKGLRRVSALGGKPEVLTEVSPEEEPRRTIGGRRSYPMERGCSSLRGQVQTSLHVLRWCRWRTARSPTSCRAGATRSIAHGTYRLRRRRYAAGDRLRPERLALTTTNPVPSSRT